MTNKSNLNNLRSFSAKARRVVNKYYSDDFNFIGLISADDYKDDSDKLFSTELKNLDSIYEINEILNPKLFADCSEILLNEGLSKIRAENYISTLSNDDKFRSTKKKIINKILSIYRKIYKKYGIEFDAYKCTDLVNEFYNKGMVAYPLDSNTHTGDFDLCMTFISPNINPRGRLKLRVDGYIEGTCTINYRPALSRNLYVPTRDIINPLDRSVNTWYINDVVIITANNLAIDCIIFTNTYDRYYNTFLYHTRLHMSDNIARMKGFSNDVKLYFTEGTRDYIILDSYDSLYNRNTNISYWDLTDFFNIFSTGSRNIRHSDFINKDKVFYTTRKTYDKYKNWIDDFLLKMDCINPEAYLRFEDVPHIYDDYLKIIYEYKGFQESIELELEPKVDSVFDIHFYKSEGKTLGYGGDYLVINSDRKIIFEDNISNTYKIINDLKSK